jgi:hypothetical protein
VLLVVVIADAVRRENQEFYAQVTNFGGSVMSKATDKEQYQNVAALQKLVDQSTVATGPGAWAELSFPDGSKVVMDASTELKIKLLEYHRGGRWRSRSFFLNTGRIFARIGENFGHESEMRVYTPACVAAARGTKFAVTADPRSKAARTLCNEGTVEVQGFDGTRMFVNQTGDCSAVAGRPPTRPVAASATEFGGFRHPSLNDIIVPEPWYVQAEMTLTQTLDAPLTILGIGKCSWAVGAADFARRTGCQEALRKIRLNLEGDTTYPLWVNPSTLEELGIQEPGGVDNLLKNFDGGSIESYRSDGRRFFITARARDKQRTRYELDGAIIRQSETQG